MDCIYKNKMPKNSMRKYYYIGLLACLIPLSGCMQSSIQTEFETIGQQCRTGAELKAANLGPAKNAASRNAELVALFSDCMAKGGWAVATPKREKTPGNAPGNPIAPGAGEASNPRFADPRLANPASNNAAPRAAPTRPRAAPYDNPPINNAPAATYSAPAQVAPPPAAAPASTPGYSVYQPAYPTPAPDNIAP
jgi:hypothetical protein